MSKNTLDKTLVLTRSDGSRQGLLLDADTEREMLALAEILAGIVGGPTGIIGIRILKLARNMMIRAQSNPEFAGYLETFEILTERAESRRGGKP